LPDFLGGVVLFWVHSAPEQGDMSGKLSPAAKRLDDLYDAISLPTGFDSDDD
jgi:hypothetical protein